MGVETNNLHMEEEAKKFKPEAFKNEAKEQITKLKQALAVAEGIPNKDEVTMKGIEAVKAEIAQLEGVKRKYEVMENLTPEEAAERAADIGEQIKNRSESLRLAEEVVSPDDEAAMKGIEAVKAEIARMEIQKRNYEDLVE